MRLALRANVTPQAARLFIFVGVVWAAVVGPYSSVLILKHFGATSPQVGVFTAVCAVASMLVQPVWGYLSDKSGSPRKILCLCLGFSAAFFGCVLFVGDLYAAAGLLFLDIFFRCGIIALLDSHTLLEINANPRMQYSYIRLAGSVFYGLMSLLYSGVINAGDAVSIIPISLCIAAAAVLWGLFFAKGKYETLDDFHGSERRAKRDLKKEALTLFKNNRYLLLICYIALNALTTSPLFVFIIDFVTAVGGSPGDVPMIHALRCAVEIPFFIYVGSVGKRFASWKIMFAGACFTFVYLIGLLAANAFPILIAGHLFGSAGFILSLTGRLRYLNEVTPESVRSTSITVMGACEIGLGSIVGNLIAGFVIGAHGTKAMALAAMVSLLCAAAVLIAIGRVESREVRE